MPNAYKWSKYRYPRQILCFYGPSGSGKTRWKQWFYQRGFSEIPSITTRAPRFSNDTEYEFVSRDHFIYLLTSRKLVNVNQYEGEYYGIRKMNIKYLPTNHCVLITDITSLLKIRTDIEKQLYAWTKPRTTVISVFCAPPENWRELFENRSPERLAIAEKEIQYFQTEGIYPGSVVIGDEKDAQNLYKAVIEGKQLSGPEFFDKFRDSRTHPLKRQYYWGKCHERKWEW